MYFSFWRIQFEIHLNFAYFLKNGYIFWLSEKLSCAVVSPFVYGLMAVWIEVTLSSEVSSLRIWLVVSYCVSRFELEQN